jgi:osmotically-inducible protein OsmY
VRYLLVPCLALAVWPSLAGQPVAPALAPQPGVGRAPLAPAEGFAAVLDDLWIGASVKARLFRSQEVRARDVEVDANAGVVTLSGMVPSLGAQAAAELAAVKLAGVRRVENWIEVVPEPEQAATRARDRALERRLRARLSTEPEVASRDLDVAICNRVARLRGSVSDRNAHRAALETAGATAGVRQVIDQLRIEGAPAHQPTLW